jgi:hypothetical protein
MMPRAARAVSHDFHHRVLHRAKSGGQTSQNSNPTNAWRYSPGGREADASVTGAVIIGLLAARNAGIVLTREPALLPGVVK